MAYPLVFYKTILTLPAVPHAMYSTWRLPMARTQTCEKKKKLVSLPCTSPEMRTDQRIMRQFPVASVTNAVSEKLILQPLEAISERKQCNLSAAARLCPLHIDIKCSQLHFFNQYILHYVEIN